MPPQDNEVGRGNKEDGLTADSSGIPCVRTPTDAFFVSGLNAALQSSKQGCFFDRDPWPELTFQQTLE
jgi:hypothetical protein